MDRGRNNKRLIQSLGGDIQKSIKPKPRYYLNLETMIKDCLHVLAQRFWSATYSQILGILQKSSIQLI